MKRFLFKRYILSIFLVAATSLILSSCAKKMRFSNSSIVPAAVGYAKIKHDNNNNYTIEVSVTNLAPPDKLTPPRKVYVVWMETESNGNQNIGQINTSSGLFSSTFKGSLKAVTTLKPKSVFITGEDDATVQYPGTPIVLNTN